MTKKNSPFRLISMLFLFTAVLIFLTSCLPNEHADVSGRPASFFMGIWHGWLAPLSLIVGIFNPETRIYETFNTGWWYDFGYYMAIISGFGGLSLFRKKIRDTAAA